MRYAIGIATALAMCWALSRQGAVYDVDCTIVSLGCILVAIALLVWRHLRGGRRLSLGQLAPAGVLALVPLAGLASALANGISLESLASLSTLLVPASVCALASLLDDEEHASVITGMTWLGVASGIAGILLFAGIWDFDGATGEGDGRLEFFFAYGATSGAFFLAMSVLALGATDGKLRWLAFPSIASLLLTLSGGAVIVALAAYLALAIVWVWRREWDRLIALCVEGVLAVCVLLVSHFAGNFWAAPSAAVGLVICAVMWVLDERAILPAKAPNLPSPAAKGAGTSAKGVSASTKGATPPATAGSPSARRPLAVRIALTAAFVIAAAALVALGLAVFGSRVGTDIANITERLEMMGDAAALWMQSPILGIGPDQFQYHYHYVQTTPYFSERVHCFYLQLACDAGIVGLLAFLAGVAWPLARLARKLRACAVTGDVDAFDGRLALLVCAAVLLAHAAIDWDFSFGLMEALLMLAVSSPSVTWESAEKSQKKPDVAADAADASTRSAIPQSVTLAATLAAACLVAVVSGVTLWAAATHDSLTERVEGGGVYGFMSDYRESTLVTNDRALATTVISECVSNNAPEQAIEWAELCGGAHGNVQVVDIAYCYQAIGEADTAERLLIDELWAEPCVAILFEDAEEFFETCGISSENAAEYHETVQAACEASGLEMAEYQEE